ncbi:MAG: hypothetical protein JSV23_01575 [Promethearchaeota archaeon]|nr:MAG: hypothetical protein JSV23_01575 [Candidatus Lokiarchaeota archaeon]
MNISVTDLNLFEDWFKTKLLAEKERRINYIRLKWDSLNIENRSLLIDFLEDKLLTYYKPFYLNKNYNEFYLILKDQIELSYELIHKWLSSKLENHSNKILS